MKRINTAEMVVMVVAAVAVASCGLKMMILKRSILGISEALLDLQLPCCLQLDDNPLVLLVDNI